MRALSDASLSSGFASDCRSSTTHRFRHPERDPSPRPTERRLPAGPGKQGNVNLGKRRHRGSLRRERILQVASGDFRAQSWTTLAQENPLGAPWTLLLGPGRELAATSEKGVW